MSCVGSPSAATAPGSPRPAEDRTIKLWDVRTGQLLRLFEGNAAPIFGLAFSPDGRRLASASADGTVKLWDVETGQEALLLRGHISSV